MTQVWIARLPSFGLTQLISFEMVVAVHNWIGFVLIANLVV
jgi:hypothetical protein